ncbi:biliverdin-producing heme oxygenase [Pseudoglutamicibacter albus]|uniref:biliverdin-producing heme oxygenase n=1 Tax=Pseudoglutamicibacter albus TaxID=98671 RepID=UPI00361AFCB6
MPRHPDAGPHHGRDALHPAHSRSRRYGLPERLIAHHYLRYLGDLSGGQAIGALVARHYNIPSELLTMWKFPTIDKPKIYKDAYRIHLDHFAQQANQAEIVDEARLGFALNRNLFVELGAPLSDNKDLYV